MGSKTEDTYQDRKSKARYVWARYQEMLQGTILDVGADECYLRQYVDDNADYLGIGLGEHVDLEVNLERGRIPFDDNSFDCVLCLDVLEHLDSIHSIFDDLCRVTRTHLLVSLPNPYKTFSDYLRYGRYDDHHLMKFYGLPPEPPTDRHKWFFSMDEAKRFVQHRAKKNDMQIIRMDFERTPAWRPIGLQKLVLKMCGMSALCVSLYEDLSVKELWALLRKKHSSKHKNHIATEEAGEQH